MIRCALLAATIVVLISDHARAQLPDVPLIPFAPPLASCRELLALRGESELYAAAIEGANARKLSVATVCGYFRSYNAIVAKMIKRLEVDGRSCGVPSTIPDQVRAGHAESERAAQRVCEAAWPRPASDKPPMNFDDPAPPFKTYWPPSPVKPRPLIIDPIPLKMGSTQRP